MSLQNSSYKSLIDQLTKKLNQTTDLQAREEIEDQLVRFFELEEDELRQLKQLKQLKQVEKVDEEDEEDNKDDSDEDNVKVKKEANTKIDKSLLSEEELRELVRQERLEKQIKNEEKYLKKSKLKNEEDELLRDKMMNDALAFDDDYANQKKRRTFGNKNKNK
jgi:hypothetical protein